MKLAGRLLNRQKTTSKPKEIRGGITVNFMVLPVAPGQFGGHREAGFSRVRQ
jgi:hypothetical protein